jgi:hypothetical protein
MRLGYTRDELAIDLRIAGATPGATLRVSYGDGTDTQPIADATGAAVDSNLYPGEGRYAITVRDSANGQTAIATVDVYQASPSLAAAVGDGYWRGTYA